MWNGSTAGTGRTPESGGASGGTSDRRRFAGRARAALLFTAALHVVQVAGAAGSPGTPTLTTVVPASTLATHPRERVALEPSARSPVRPLVPRPLGRALPEAGPPRPAYVGTCRWPDARTLAAIVPVTTNGGSHASGVVFVSGQVLTAAHAVKGASRFFVRVDGDFRRADLLLVDHVADLAVLGVDTAGILPLPLATNDLVDRETVWAAGFPRARAMTTSAGVVQRNRAGALHTSAPIDEGQSGGGLLACTDGAYRLAGMLRGYGAYLSGDRYVKLSNHSVSVTATTINRFLNAYR